MDLEGAKTGQTTNLPTIERIAAQTGEIFAVDKTLTLTGLQMIYAAHCKEKAE